MEIQTCNRWQRSRMYTACSRRAPRCKSSECPQPTERLANQIEPSDAELKLVDAYKDLKPVFMQPPWAILPWKDPTLPRPVFKKVLHPPDITVTGRIFDLFV